MEPPKADIEIARKVLTFLEDRRVLYNPLEVELPQHCIQSVLEIRQFLTDLMTGRGQADDLQDNLRAMRAACRRFLERMHTEPEVEDIVITPRVHWMRGVSDYILNQALGELRGVFGIHIAQIAVKYGLDVEDPLTAVLPPDPQTEA